MKKNDLLLPGKETQPFIIESTYNAAVDQVWHALTDPALMKQWYFDIPEFETKRGFKFSFEAGKDENNKYKHLCEVTEVVPEKKLTYSWRYDKFEGDSYVTFELFPDKNKTVLVLTHRGLESFPANNPDFAKERFAEGWTYITGTSLKGFLEKERPDLNEL